MKGKFYNIFYVYSTVYSHSNIMKTVFKSYFGKVSLVGALYFGKCLLFISYKYTYWLSLPIVISYTLCCYYLE